MSSGFVFGDNITKVVRCSFVSDASAIAVITNVMEHGGFVCCRKCVVIGELHWTLKEKTKFRNNTIDSNEKFMVNLYNRVL